MGEEEKIKELKELMVKQANIRNVCTSAHIHHGKCISGGSRVFVADIGLKSAKDIFEEVAESGEVYEDNEDHTIFVPKKEVLIYSLNKETNKIEKRPVKYVWRLKGGNTLKVKLRNGFEVNTTPEHKYLIFDDGFNYKEAKNLKIGDRIVCDKIHEFFWKEKNVNIEDYNSVEVVVNDNGKKLIQIIKNIYEDITFVDIIEISEGFEDVVYDFTVPDNHNFIAEGMVIHNTALTDNLLAASGYMSARAAGSLEEGMATWQHLDEQERLMTVDAANVSMVHEFEGQKFLINLIDTPGHVDFGGNVTRAMRAIDGTICLVCGVEGIMPQTETVVKQALRERVKPVLFINKVDRMINELKLTPEQMQQRLLKLVLEFNQLIERTVEPEFRDKWKVDISDGSVAFGSARENWALSVSFMKKKNITFKDIIDLYLTGKPQEEVKKWTWKNAPLYEVLLDMVIKHLPNPLEAQKYRIPKIWSGDLDSELGKNLLNCDPKGKTAFVITRVVIDQKSGRELAAGRLFSGVLTEGMNVYLNSAKMYQRVAQVFMYKGVKPESVGEVGAGNVLALGGISGYAGETITLEPEQPFEELRHIFEPVITKAIEPAKPQDLPKLVEVLKKVGKEDPSVKIEINEETGENLISGMGELHLEIIENRIITEKGLQIKTSAPMVVYRETVTKVSPEVEGKSPNKHNKFYFTVEPLNDNIYRAIKDGRLIETKAGKKEYPDWKKLVDLGMETKEARKIKDVYNANVLLDNTRGIVHIGEVIDLIIEGFEQVIQAGPLAREPCTKLLVRIHDLKLHEDAIHRGPSQVLPAVRNALREGMLNAGAVMFEPVQVLMIECPENYLGEMSRLVQNKRGQLLDVNSEGGGLVIKAKLPVAEMIGLSSDLRSATEGRGNFFISDQLFEKLPEALKEKTIKNIRSRKGLSAEETSTT